MNDRKTSSNLNAKNYLNLLAYVANCAVVQAIGAFGLFNLPSNSELSQKYQVSFFGI
jgi:hypothetical protein